eukprot:Hpha_TRINITY_DN15240_c0_g1::TRINITY_DN15240_c0_g1_i1::g.66110::m.66110
MRSGLCVALFASACCLGLGCSAEVVREDTTAVRAEFLDWLQTAGANHSGVDLHHSTDRNWHLVATEDLPTGKTFASIPWDIVHSSSSSGTVDKDGNDTKAESPGAILLAGTDYAGYGGELELVLRLIRERRKGDPTPHFNVMPQIGHDFGTSVHWDETDLACASQQARALHEHQVGLLQAFTQAIQTLQGQVGAAKLFGGGGEEASEEEIKWAYGIVGTRAIQQEGEVFLVPLMDMLNHDSGEGKGTEIVLTSRGIELRTQGPVSAGSELFLNYGSHLSPSKLLAFYGFADESFSSVFSHISLPASVGPPFAELGCLDQKQLWIAKDGTVSPKVLECVLLTILPGENRSAYAASSPEERSVVAEEKRHTVLQVLSNHLRQVLGAYPGRLDAACEGSHHLVPLIRSSNTAMREVFMNAKSAMDEEVRLAKAPAVITSEQLEKFKARSQKRKERQQQADQEIEGLDQNPYANSEAFARWHEEHKIKRRQREEERREREREAGTYIEDPDEE